MLSFAFWMYIDTFTGIIKEKIKFIIMKNKNILYIALGTALLLMVPLIGMQVSEGVRWTLSDFVIAGALLFGTGLAYEFISKKGGTLAYRAGVGMAVMTSLLLIWINLAVGIIGNENNPANLLYFGVILVGIIGVIISRFRASAMSQTAFAMAITQVLVPVIAFAIWRPPFNMGVVQVFVLSGGFAVLYAGAALLPRNDQKD